jgi:hypothetical protein
MLSVIMLNVIMLSVVMLSVVAPNIVQVVGKPFVEIGYVFLIGAISFCQDNISSTNKNIVHVVGKRDKVACESME